MDWATAERFLDKYGLATLVALYFMFGLKAEIRQLARLVNKLLITNVVIAKTLNLDAEQARLIAAADDDGSQGGP